MTAKVDHEFIPQLGTQICVCGALRAEHQKYCDVCGGPAVGRCRVDAKDGPMLGYLCDRDADDMAALLSEWLPFDEPKS